MEKKDTRRNVYIISDSTIDTLRVHDSFKSALENYFPKAKKKSCNTCPKKMRTVNDSYAKAKRAILNLGPKKLNELKKLFNTKRIRVILNNIKYTI